MIALGRLMISPNFRGSAAAARLDRPFSLGGRIKVDAARNRIVRDGHVVELEPRLMQLLLYLARSPGRTVPKQELMEQVWRAHVVDDAIHRAVSLLRSAFGDSARAPAILQTVPRHGYRLLLEPVPEPSVPPAIVVAGAAAVAGTLVLAAGLMTVAGPEPAAEQIPNARERSLQPAVEREATLAQRLGEPTEIARSTELLPRTPSYARTALAAPPVPQPSTAKAPPAEPVLAPSAPPGRHVEGGLPAVAPPAPAPAAAR